MFIEKPQLLQWINLSKQRRYVAYLHYDLFNDWIITKSWCGINSNRGSQKTEICANYLDGQVKLAKETSPIAS